MKQIFIFIILLLLFISGCIVIPKNIPAIENITYSIPLGDTVLSVLDVVTRYPNSACVRGDTVFSYTDIVMWRNAYLPTKDTIRISINLEEEMPAEVIDTNRDSTYFSSTIDKVENYVRFWGTVPYTTGAHLIHSIYSSGRLVYVDSVDVLIMKRDNLDTTYYYTAYDFPIGNYYHEIAIAIDSGQTFIDSIEARSLIALKFKLTGDRIMTVRYEQLLPFTPPEESPLRMINWVNFNLNIWNRIPFSSNLILMLIDSMDNIVFNDTFLLNAVPKDDIGRGIGTGAFSVFNLHLSNELYDLFKYSTIKAKARLEVPAPDDENVFITPEDYVRIEGAFQMNVDFDYNLLPIDQAVDSLTK